MWYNCVSFRQSFALNTMSSREELERISRSMYNHLVSGGWIPPNTTFELDPRLRRQRSAGISCEDQHHGDNNIPPVASSAGPPSGGIFSSAMPEAEMLSISFYFSTFSTRCQYPNHTGGLMELLHKSRIPTSSVPSALKVNNKEETIWDMAIRILQPKNGSLLKDQHIRSTLGKARKKWPDEELRRLLEHIGSRDFVDPLSYFIACVQRGRGKFDPGRLSI